MGGDHANKGESQMLAWCDFNETLFLKIRGELKSQLNDGHRREDD